MSRAEKLGFISAVQTAIQDRISKTDDICNKFDKCYSGSQPLTVQIIILSAIGVTAFTLLGFAINITPILNIFSIENTNISNFARFSLLCMCIYLGTHIYRNILRIVRTAKIDGHKFIVKNTKRSLKKQLDNIHSMANDADKVIIRQSNTQVVSKSDIDSNISKYYDIVKKYSNQDKVLIANILTIMHWVASLIFVYGVLLATASSFSIKMYELTKYSEFGFFYVSYASLLFLAYVFIQKLFKDMFIKDLFYKTQNIIGIILLLSLSIIVVYSYYLFSYTLLKEGIDFGFINSQIFWLLSSYTPYIIGTIFASIICKLWNINKNVINIFHIICITGFAIMLSLNINFTSIEIDFDNTLVFITLYSGLIIGSLLFTITYYLKKMDTSNLYKYLLLIPAGYTVLVLLISYIQNNQMLKALAEENIAVETTIPWLNYIILGLIATVVSMIPCLLYVLIVSNIKSNSYSYKSTKQKVGDIVKMAITGIIGSVLFVYIPAEFYSGSVQQGFFSIILIVVLWIASKKWWFGILGGFLLSAGIFFFYSVVPFQALIFIGFIIGVLVGKIILALRDSY